ncbi:unnamed protein product [Linum tenue]|uniref:ABC1 atypical kinase-like domain-containing protein n=2 Tax=Linum tenue TaxID=586396 RepID=A0AAV0GUG6_9ROSI|nr:unnamed protein product [Linum tenue]
MRNVSGILKRHGRIALLSRISRFESSALAPIGSSSSVLAHGGIMEINNRACSLQQRLFSTTFTSVHGEKPSGKYAKLRKESLESEFGQALGIYSSSKASHIYRFGPFLAIYRAAIISYHLFKLTIWQLFVKDMRERAIMFRETLVSLGPFYIKASGLYVISVIRNLGQALSTRPDVLPTIYCQELAKLQDQIPPFPTKVAIRSIESQLGRPISQIFADISPEPVASASLGQVYKAHLHSGELVAVKVQRPGISHSLTLDALLFNMIGGQLKRFAKARKDLLVAVNEMESGDNHTLSILDDQVRHMFDEIDYILEAKNAERFATLYGCEASTTVVDENENYVKVPKIYWDLTRKAVLTMEWIDGIKLTNEARLSEACLDRRKLIDQGLYCSLRQLLEVGFFHADPHPGNLVATDSGHLAYFDFGMMGDIPRPYRVGLIQVLVHFVNRDSLGLANDFLSLGFIPEGVDIRAVADALQVSFGDGSRQSRDFEAIMNQLYDVMYDFNFSLPPDYALVIRALGSLEGTAKVLDPNFKVVESAYPFVIGRLLADPNPDMRRILRQLLISNDGSIRWNRLERLIAAISQESASEPTGEAANSKDDSPNTLGWKSFDMRAVVSATEDLLLFVLSQRGSRVRVFLLRDMVKAADAFIQDEVIGHIFDDNPHPDDVQQASGSEEHKMVTRVTNGFRYLARAMKMAPEVWTAMLIRMAMKPEFHQFSVDAVSAFVMHFNSRVPETYFICVSRLLHKLATKSIYSDSVR